MRRYFDAESGLSYNYFRDYDPGTGRYQEKDPLGLAGGINEYLYAEGDPISLFDPNGLCAPNMISFIKKMCPFARASDGEHCNCRVSLSLSGKETGWGSSRFFGSGNEAFGRHGTGDAGGTCYGKRKKKDGTCADTVKRWTTIEASWESFCRSCNGIKYENDRQWITDVTYELGFAIDAGDPDSQQKAIEVILKNIKSCEKELEECCSSGGGK